MTDEDILAEFRASDALLDGHFVLSSGRHSPQYLQCARVLMNGQRADRLPRQRRHAFLRRAARDDAGAHASDGRLVESERTLRAGLGAQ